MQPSLPAEPGDRNIKAADLADSADIAKIVDTAALRTDARQHPRQIPLICDRERRPLDRGSSLGRCTPPSAATGAMLFGARCGSAWHVAPHLRVRRGD